MVFHMDMENFSQNKWNIKENGKMGLCKEMEELYGLINKDKK